MLQLHQSNRLDRLADALIETFETPTGRHPLEAEQVVVQSPGMATWLRHRWAVRTGVAAAVDFPLPAVLLWKVVRALVPEAEAERTSPYHKQLMAWRLMALLGEERLADPDFAPVARYLDDDATGLKRYQLAQRIADLFDQYLIYRPDWTARWRRDPDGAAAALPADARWQPKLWQHLVRACDHRPDRALLQARALQCLMEEPSAQERVRRVLPPRIALFGLSALPPEQLRFLLALSAHLDVHLYLPNPCREYWGDLVSERDRAQRIATEAARGDARTDAYFETGHPLLGALGRAGRDHVDLLLELGADDGETSLFEPPDGERMLAIVQRDMLDLRPLDGPPIVVPDADRSIQFVDCYGPMREVEVLHDWLLARFAADATLTPRDVVVMIPDIDRYAPFVEAVFGGVEARATRMPFSIADRGARTEAPVLNVIAELLRLPRSRFGVSELLGILENPAVMRAFGVDEGGFEQLAFWLDEAGVRWGRDAAHWARLGFPAHEAGEAPLANTWAFGVERLLLGYAMGDSDGSFAEVLPLAGVEGSGVEMLGALLEFLRQIDRFTARLAGPHPPAIWARHLADLLETFLAPDDEEDLALGPVRELIADLAEIETAQGIVEPFSLDVVQAALEPVLRAPAGAHRFLAGGITFCTLMPMRSIPFRLVCLLGMNDEDYPRRERPLGFDLIALAPRRGDRARRLEDRYLFLEAILSAREGLYLSWTGRSATDDSVRPPSVVVSELVDVLVRRFVPAGGGDLRDALTQCHPLQPFSAAYGETGPLQTFSTLWAFDGLSRDRAPADDVLPALAAVEAPSLRTLTAFLIDPCAQLLAERLEVRFAAASGANEDDEPFRLDGLERYRIRAAALDALRSGTAFDAWALREGRTGRLPHAGAALAELFSARSHIEAFRERLGTRLAQRPEALVVSPALDALSLEGEVTDCYPDMRLVLRTGTARARDFMRLWIAHLALAAAELGRPSALMDDKTIHWLEPVAPEAAREALQRLVEVRARVLSSPAPLLVDSAWAYVKRLRKPDSAAAALAAAKSAWSPSWGEVPGEGERPAVARLWPAWPGDDPQRRAEFEALSEQVWGPLASALGTADAARIAPAAPRLHRVADGRGADTP
ncbi:MAG: exodeoxyribonuclease V subunit gamma [Pseudomonadales bacterium]|jgi:exodeoxyribonuclease V gamma subunit|nr:exodeoxyribonuclease V subunit gamma [Pseudomonadales bacterium]